MKVLYITNLPAPYRVDFFNELGKQVELTVLYERESATDRDKRWTKDTAHTFREIYLEGKKVGAASGASRQVLSYIKDSAYDIRVLGGYSSPTAMLALRYMKRKGIPYILSIDGGFVHPENILKKKLKSYLISGAKLYLSTGKNGDRLLTHYGAPEKDIFRYHFTSLFENNVLSAPPTPEEKEAYRKKLGIEKKYCFLTVGRLLPLKRFDLFMEAVHAIPDSCAIIAGGMPDSYHKKLLSQYPDADIRFVDFMPYSALSEYFRAADIFVMPTDSDVWGLVLAEAMANGLPVVAADGCGAAADLIQDGVNGYTVPKGDAKTLTEKIKATLPYRETFSENSIKIIKEFTIEHEVHDHLLAFRAFCER